MALKGASDEGLALVHLPLQGAAVEGLALVLQGAADEGLALVLQDAGREAVDGVEPGVHGGDGRGVHFWLGLGGLEAVRLTSVDGWVGWWVGRDGLDRGGRGYMCGLEAGREEGIGVVIGWVSGMIGERR